MEEPTNKSQSKIDPGLKERLLKESRNPFKGFRRLIWLVLFGSALFGLLIMLTRSFSSESVQINDIAIQTSAFLLFGGLLWFDREIE